LVVAGRGRRVLQRREGERERDEGGWASNCGVDCSGKDGGESGGG
jgi:hypothetical protein